MISALLPHKILHKTAIFFGGHPTIYAICFLGIVLRLWIFLGAHNLWLDEAHLANATRKLGFSGLLMPLENDQIAPVGFLVLAKLSGLVFVQPELALRLPSLIAGICTIFLTVWWCRLRHWSVPMTNALLIVICFFQPYLRYSAEYKQYGLEMVFCLLMLCCIEWYRQRPGIARQLIVGGAGIGASFCSITAPFILCMPGMILLIDAARKRRLANLILATAICAAWGVLYLYLLRHIAPASSSTMQSMKDVFWKDDMLPSAGIGRRFAWALAHFIGIFTAGGFGIAAGAAAVCFLIAVCAQAKNTFTESLLFLGPLTLAFCASLVGKYPFADRLLLFAMPGVLPFVIAGGFLVWRRLADLPLARIAAASLMLAAGIMPVAGQLHGAHPFEIESFPRVIAWLDRNYQMGDKIYVMSYAIPLMRNELPNLKAPLEAVTMGHDPRAVFGNEFAIDKPGNYEWFMSDFQELQHNTRVWMVMTRLYDPAMQALRAEMLYLCRDHGRLADQYEDMDTATYLCIFDHEDDAWHFRMPEMDYVPIHKSYALPSNR